VTPGNLELLQIVVSWAVTLPAVAAIIVHDERRLVGERRDRAWPAVSRDAAIFALWNLGVPHLCVLVHFGRTRRGLAGFAIGLAALAAVVALDVGAQLGTAQVVEWLDPGGD
jgi:hypothetical protein